FVAALACTQTAEGSVVDTALSSFSAAFAPIAGPAHELDGPPARAGRYRLGRRLGSGAMGSVYAAHDPELGRELAIKLVRLGAGVTAQARERLLREAKALAKVAHPSVVAVYDVGAVDDQLFIAMELVHTGTLRTWLAQPRPLADVLRVMTDAGRGLAAAH